MDFKKRMRLQWLLRDKDASKVQNATKCRPKSTWNPPKSDSLLESCLSILDRRALSISPEGKSYPNLSSFELSALRILQSDSSLIIKEGDKDPAVIAWGRDDYVTEAARQLNDRLVYEEGGPYCRTGQDH